MMTSIFQDPSGTSLPPVLAQSRGSILICQQGSSSITEASDKDEDDIVDKIVVDEGDKIEEKIVTDYKDDNESEDVDTIDQDEENQSYENEARQSFNLNDDKAARDAVT
ncbi:uncharacterized protein LOC120164831 [Hibiscus syriacus]|uniref:uncharacterized protein LOC120164831 n=1 Tax=Hibiscus syriacus TaxID=106335 RepID=UPI0019204F9A|nr:uncharacterized protein LOC120164831 [Hibiscus syriacus]XP_039030410.1 uncharacterized protein LOC120164831 [Hibiscus syriacus]